MHTLCKCLGGSHLYSLDTPESDTDWRGVFCNTKVSQIIGLDRHEHDNRITKEADIMLWELRHFLNMGRKGNSQFLELLFNNNWTEKTAFWDTVQSEKTKLLDSEKIYNSITGYIYNEKRLVLGERLGQIGGKRVRSLEKFGYSEKNATQCIRLCLATTHFFRDGRFLVDLKEEPLERDFLFSIKTNPARYSVSDITVLIDQYRATLDTAFENRVHNFKFDLDYANDLCLNCYRDFLQ